MCMWRYRSESHGEGRVVQEVKWGLLDKSIERCTRRETTVLGKSLLKSRISSSAAFRQWEEFHSWRVLQVQTSDQCRRRPCEERTAMGVVQQTARAEGCHKWRQMLMSEAKNAVGEFYYRWETGLSQERWRLSYVMTETGNWKTLWRLTPGAGE